MFRAFAKWPEKGDCGKIFQLDFGVGRHLDKNERRHVSSRDSCFFSNVWAPHLDSGQLDSLFPYVRVRVSVTDAVVYLVCPSACLSSGKLTRAFSWAAILAFQAFLCTDTLFSTFQNDLKSAFGDLTLFWASVAGNGWLMRRGSHSRRTVRFHDTVNIQHTAVRPKVPSPLTYGSPLCSISSYRTDVTEECRRSMPHKKMMLHTQMLRKTTGAQFPVTPPF